MVDQIRGQVSAFTIVGVIIVFGIVLFFLVSTGNLPTQIGGFEENPQVHLQNCLEPKIKEGIELLGTQGGYIEPGLSIEFGFDGEKIRNISYLCYTSNNYLPCNNIEPVLIGHLEEEIEKHISQEIRSCFLEWQDKMEEDGYSVSMGSLNYGVEFEPSRVVFEAQREVSANKKEESINYDSFRIVITDKIYDLAIIAQEILSQEARFCAFQNTGFMLLYPDFEVDKFRTGSLDTIYSVGHRNSGEKFRFSIRGCVIPPGI